MKKLFPIILTFVLVIIIGDAIMAQAQHTCGMTAEHLQEVKEQLLANRRELEGININQEDVTYVPIRFHLVAESDGSNRATYRQALTSLCQINAAYEPHEIQFYIEEFNEIDNTALYNNPSSFGGSIALNNNLEYDAINVFVVGADLGGGSGGGITLAYYQPPAGPNSGADFIVCNKSYLTDEFTMAHEIGHFLSLPHPFNGWDFEPWDPADHGNPVFLNTAPGGGAIELANGSNCTFAGDGLCDTPADYNFGITYNSGCNYTGNAQDPNGQLVNPLKENIMNYFGCNTQTFTDDQSDAMNASLLTSARDYVTPNYTPVLDEITGSTILLSPLFGETIETFNSVDIEWEEKDGATDYVVEITGAQNFTILTTGTSLTLTNLQPESSYIVRVIPYNESWGCANSSINTIFSTGNVNSVKEVTEIANWRVAPNPLTAGSNIQLLLNVDEAFDGTISLLDMTGKAIEVVENNFTPGNFSMNFNTSNLANGIYLIAIQTDQGVSQKKVVIAR